MTDTTAHTLEAFGASFLRLHQLVHSDAVAEMSARPGYSMRPREDTPQRATGTYSDSTFNTVTDPRRMEVAAAADDGEQALKAALQTMRRVEATLRLAAGG